MNSMITKPTKTRLFSRSLVLLAVMLGIQLGAMAQTQNPAPYCGVAHPYMGTAGSCANGWGFAFQRITLNTLDHKVKCTSTNSTPGPYRYYSIASGLGYTTTLTPGSSYSVYVQSASASYPIYAAAWIDLDQNNAFSAAENILITPQMAPPNGSHTRNFTLPCTAKPGKTRIRFSCDYYQAFTTSQFCATSYGYGETIDYEITIANASNPSANFLLPDTIFTNSPTVFTNSNQIGYVSHVWSTSVAGLGTPVPAGVNFTYAFPSAGNYQVRLVSTNCGGSSTVTKNVTVINPTTAPTVRFLASRNYIPIPPGGVVSELVDLKDYSTSGPTSYQWEVTPDDNFGGYWFVSNGSYSGRSVQLFFFEDEKYDVCMTASNSIGSSKLCKYDYIVIETPTTGGGYKNEICTNNASSLDSGILYSPNRPSGSNYVGPYNCDFLISACDAEEIEFWFEGNFNLSYYATLSIYDGKTTNAPDLFSVATGGSAPVTSTSSKHYYAKSGSVLINFFVQYSFYPAAGFELHWKTKKRNDGPLVAGFDVLGTRNDSIYSCAAGTEVSFQNTTKGTTNINPLEYQWIFDYDPNISYPSGYADAPDNNDNLKPIYTYYNDKTYTVRLVAKSCEGWDTTFQTFHISTTSMVPQVDFVTTQNIIKVGQSTTLRQTTVAHCSGKWTINPTTYTILNSGSLNDPEINVQFNAVGRYTVKYEATNDNGTASRTRADFIRVIDFCTPAVTDAYQSMAISNVEFNTINNPSVGNGTGFENFSNLSTEAYIGGTYNLNVTRASLIDASDMKAWIDYNRDGNFDATEEVASLLNGKSNLTTTVTIPSIASVTPGQTILRIGNALAGGKLDPCGPVDAGEFEDYTVNISPDNMAPMINMIGSDTVYIEKNSKYTDAGATANDNLEGNITSRIVIKNQVDTAQTGVYIVSYNVMDGSGLPAPQRIRYVFVVADMTNPVLTVTGGATITHEVNTPYTDLGATATDNPGAANISNLVIANNTVDATKLGTYTVDYSVTDAYGNKAMGTRTVNVVDSKAPVINCAAQTPFKVQVGTTFTNPTTVMDNYWKNVSLDVVAGSVETTVFGKYKVTYTATDGSGNKSANVTCEYEVNDLVPPVLASTGSQLVVADVNDFNFAEQAVTGTDNYFKTVQITRNPGTFDITKLGSYDIVYTGTDGAGNTTTWTRTIKVVDRVKPVVLSQPINVMRWQTFDPMAGVSTFDNYYSPAEFTGKLNGCKLEIISGHNVNALLEGVYQIYYQAVDGSGNVSEPHGRTVYVMPNTTSVNEFTSNSVNIYPNPTSGKFDVNFTMALEGNTTVNVTDVTGKTVQSFTTTDIVNNTLSVDLSSAAAGIYFVNVANNGTVITQKVSITR